MKEALLVRFEKHQRAFIRKTSKKFKISEAEYVRRCVDTMPHEKKQLSSNSNEASV